MSGDRKVLLFVYSLSLLQGLTMRLMPLLFGRVGATFDVGMARQGQLQSAFSFGALIVGLIGGVLQERLGTKRTTVLTLLLLSIGAFVMGVAPAHLVLIVGGILFGMGNGWMTVVFSTPVAHCFNEQRQKVFTWAMLFMAIGGTIGPYLFSFFLTRAASWQAVVIGLGTLLLLGSLVFSAAHTPVLDTIHAPRERRKETHWAVVREGTLWLTTSLFLLHGFGGSILNTWVVRLYQDKLSISDGQAALLLSANAAGFFLGRLVLGKWLAGKLPDRVLLAICTGGGTLPYVLVIIAHNYTFALVVMCSIGVMMSGDSPSIYSLVAKQFASSASVAFALVQAFGALGATAGPWLAGWLGEKYGLQRAIWFGPCFLIVLAAAALTWEFADRFRDHRITPLQRVPKKVSS